MSLPDLCVCARARACRSREWAGTRSGERLRACGASHCRPPSRADWCAHRAEERRGEWKRKGCLVKDGPGRASQRKHVFVCGERVRVRDSNGREEESRTGAERGREAAATARQRERNPALPRSLSASSPADAVGRGLQGLFRRPGKRDFSIHGQPTVRSPCPSFPSCPPSALLTILPLSLPPSLHCFSREWDCEGGYE